MTVLLTRAKILFQVIMVLNSALLVAGSGTLSAHAKEEPQDPVPRFTVPSTLTIPSGSFTLKWTSPEDPVSTRFELQEGTQRNFSSPRIIYAGPDRGTYISGLPNGDFFYRVRLVNVQEPEKSQWSSPVHRAVQHPSLTFALSVMGVGAIVLISTISIIAVGAKNEKR